MSKGKKGRTAAKAAQGDERTEMARILGASLASGILDVIEEKRFRRSIETTAKKLGLTLGDFFYFNGQPTYKTKVLVVKLRESLIERAKKS